CGKLSMNTSPCGGRSVSSLGKKAAYCRTSSISSNSKECHLSTASWPCVGLWTRRTGSRHGGPSACGPSAALRSISPVLTLEPRFQHQGCCLTAIEESRLIRTPRVKSGSSSERFSSCPRPEAFEPRLSPRCLDYWPSPVYAS